MKDELFKLGKNIKKFRKLAGMSQEKLAETVGLHSTTIGRIEIGKLNTSVQTIFKIAKALNIPTKNLFE